VPTPASLDHLQQVQELNRAFLDLLRVRVREQRHCFGLPDAGRRALHQASNELLDAVALFPRALFGLDMGPAHPRRGLTSEPSDDEIEHDLSLSMLLAIRHTSRQSPYQARLLFGLSTLELTKLATLPLAELQRLACTPRLIQCAFRDRAWFWAGVLTATRPEVRRQLMLMALQPRVVIEWPRRRPAQSIR
jgi:hypothetical protein